MTLNYNHIIGRAVSIKWPDPADRELWYAKLTIARRRKLGKLYRAQNGQCVFCHRPTWLWSAETTTPPQGLTRKARATLEHCLPMSEGGTDNLANLAMSCHDCNNRRGVIDYEHFASIRPNDELWRAHTKKLAHQLAGRKQERNKERSGKRQLMLLNLAIVFYLHSNFG